ncbi:LacI family DNA-binding transcriptional regulator [Paracidobacterium acidisoli]|uniref:LacI family transcriptional regulator n=1 Tax=Paracidobacterium acidisoli TaxID=2303751 RepID=A0A372IJU6_9BACT|nr:LacI family DNA-binding transcriptional regulator [Paracidobacterium acidisoli]MBT9333082.1 LacI family transcriptional regulator [Paracidobacterium acidisoli]
MNDKSKKIRLVDVAREANVSAATVSRLIAGSAEVNPRTRERITDAAKRLGFSLETGKKSRIIAFLLSNRGVLHPFHSSVLTGAETYCAENDYGLLFLSLKYSMSTAPDELELPEILLNRQIVAGVIMAGTNSKSLTSLLTQRRMPWVALGNNIVGEMQQKQPGLVYFDDMAGAYDLTRYLQSLGHRHIGFIGDRRLPWFARRHQAYQRAMLEAGLAARSSELNTREGEEMGYLATKLMLQETPTLTAIFAGDDALAGGVYKAIRDSGMTIPDDVSVAGFNDTLEASFLHPPLTSVRVFADELGRQLAESMLKTIAEPDQPPRSLILPTQLVRRESCAALISPEKV